MRTNPSTQCSESTHGELSATFPGIMRARTQQLSSESCECERSRMVRRTLTHGPSENPSSNFPQVSVKLPHASAAAYSETFHFPLSFHRTFRRTFRKVSAGLSALSFRRTFQVSVDFPQCFRTDACVQRIAPKVLENPVPLVGPQGRRVLP